MKFEQLEAFIEIAATKSISIAAENLYMSQPTLSRQIKQLEEEFNFLFFAVTLMVFV